MTEETQTESVYDLSFRRLRAANVTRQHEWSGGDEAGHLDLSFKGNELAGEGGEAVEALMLHAAELGRLIGRACNIVKKLERERYGWRGSRATKEDLAAELADVILCVDLAANEAGIDLAPAVAAKFNATSAKVGLRTMLFLDEVLTP